MNYDSVDPWSFVKGFKKMRKELPQASVWKRSNFELKLEYLQIWRLQFQEFTKLRNIPLVKVILSVKGVIKNVEAASSKLLQNIIVVERGSYLMIYIRELI